MSIATSPVSLTEHAVARATGQTLAQVRELLFEEWRRGLVERTDDGWRLSDEAERLFGPALRTLGDEPMRSGLRRSPAHPFLRR